MFVLNELPCSLCAGLRYLVAICKDLGQHYDHYQKKLSKLERVNAARNPTMGQGGALTRIGGPAPGQDNQGGYTPVPEQYIQEVSIPDPPPSEYGYEEYAYQRYKLPRPSDYGTSKTALGVTVVLASAVAFLLRRLVSSIGI